MGQFKGVVIEELFVGEEYTFQAFVDEEHLVAMPLAQDHTNSFERSIGSITSGIGAYSDTYHLLPFLSQEEYDASLEIMKEAIGAIAKESESYKNTLLTIHVNKRWT